MTHLWTQGWPFLQLTAATLPGKSSLTHVRSELSVLYLQQTNVWRGTGCLPHRYAIVSSDCLWLLNAAAIAQCWSVGFMIERWFLVTIFGYQFLVTGTTFGCGFDSRSGIGLLSTWKRYVKLTVFPVWAKRSTRHGFPVWQMTWKQYPKMVLYNVRMLKWTDSELLILSKNKWKNWMNSVFIKYFV